MGAINIKIFGERNTGTNALKALIETNSASRVMPSVAKEIDPNFDFKTKLLKRVPQRYRARLTEAYIDNVFKRKSPKLAWKHAATYFADIACFEDCPVIATIRNPISWLHGLHRAPYHALTQMPVDFGAFLHQEWRLCGRDNLDDRAVLPTELWNKKARSLLTLGEHLQRRNLPAVIVKFEDFVGDQDATFARLKNMLEAPAAWVTIVQRSTKDKSKDHKYYANYYGKERWRNEIPPEAAQAAVKRIDWGIAGAFGYEQPSFD